MAISCSLNKDLLRSNTCGYSLPEVKDIYLANFADVVSAGTIYDCESGVTVTGITLATGATFYHIEPAKNSVEFLALGRTVGLEASEQSVAGGGDTNGITVTLSGNVTETAVPLNAAAIDVVKGN